MPLTVPQGGTIAGRAASLTPAPVAEIGGIIADVGSAVASRFGQIKAQQEAVQTQRTTLDITREIGRERQRFDQVTDPAQIEAEWPVFVQGLTERYATETGPDGRPLRSPEQVAALGLTIQELGDRHGLALGQRAIDLTQSQQTAAWTEARAAITTEAATADPDTLFALLELGEGAIDQRLANGLIMPDGAATEKAAFRAEVYIARAIQVISEDPAGFLADAEAGEFNDIGAERIATLRVSAQAEIDRRAAAEVKAGEAAVTEQNRVMDQRLTTMTTLLGKDGVPVADMDYLNDPAVQARPGYAAARAAADLYIEMPQLAQMTPAQLDAAIASEEAAPKSEVYQAERLEVLRARREAAAKGLTTDPKLYATEAGLPVPQIDMTDPDRLATTIAQSMAYATTLQRDGYVSDARAAVLTEADRTAMRAVTAPEAEVQPKLDLAIAIARGTQGNPDFLSRIIGADPVFAEAARVLAETGSEGVATSILRGQQRVATGTAEVPAKADQIAVFDDITGGVFQDDPTSKARIMAAATALFADTSAGVDVSADNIGEVTELYTTAVQVVTGASPDRNGDLTIGGVQPFRDAMVRLPPGVPLADVETAVDNLWYQLNGRAKHPETGQWLAAPTTPDVLRAFRSASVDGRVPNMDQLTADPDIIEEMVIERIPGARAQYRFVYPDGRGYNQILRDDQGLEYRFRMEDLIRGAAE